MNEIKGNEYGIKCISSDPWITQNQIIDNENDGIYTISIEDFH